MVRVKISAAKETDIQWRQIRCAEKSLKEIRACDHFAKGAQFVGQPLPVALSDATVEHLELMLMDELLRLKS